MADTAGFKMKQAWADVQVALIKAGDVILPIVAGVAGAFGDLLSTFADLPEPAQKIVLGFLALAATAGPLIYVGGGLVKNFREISAGLKLIQTSSLATSGALGAIGATLAVLTAGLTAYAYVQNRANEGQRRSAAYTKDVAAALKDEFDALVALHAEQGGYVTSARSAEQATAALNEALRSGDNGAKLVDAWAPSACRSATPSTSSTTCAPAQRNLTGLPRRGSRVSCRCVEPPRRWAT